MPEVVPLVRVDVDHAGLQRREHLLHVAPAGEGLAGRPKAAVGAVPLLAVLGEEGLVAHGTAVGRPRGEAPSGCRSGAAWWHHPGPDHLRQLERRFGSSPRRPVAPPRRCQKRLEPCEGAPGVPLRP